VFQNNLGVSSEIYCTLYNIRNQVPSISVHGNTTDYNVEMCRICKWQYK